jgi:hypothetical protein
MGYERNRPRHADGGGIFGVYHRSAGPTAKKAGRFGGAGRTAGTTRSARDRACRAASTRSARDRTAVVPAASAQRVAACSTAAHCDSTDSAPAQRVAAYRAPA